MIISTKWIPKGYDAFTVWPFIFVRPEFRNSEALLRHEYVHYDSQAWITPFWLVRYWLSEKFRWAQEVKAYKVQIACKGITLEKAATYLTTYGTGHTFEQAVTALTAST